MTTRKINLDDVVLNRDKRKKVQDEPSGAVYVDEPNVIPTYPIPFPDLIIKALTGSHIGDTVYLNSLRIHEKENVVLMARVHERERVHYRRVIRSVAKTLGYQVGIYWVRSAGNTTTPRVTIKNRVGE